MDRRDITRQTIENTLSKQIDKSLFLILTFQLNTYKLTKVNSQILYFNPHEDIQVFITQGILDLDSIDNCLQTWNK